LMMTIAEWRWIRTKDPDYLVLAKRWAKGTAILFAVGAVSGTVLSFELGLLWPTFMEKAGPIIGPLFALEGFAFFTEAIFLGIYLYGWTRLSPQMHVVTGAVVAISGVASAISVTIANAWMNAPRGFDMAGNIVRNIRPIEVMTNPYAPYQTVHMVLAAFAATGMFVVGIHAAMLLHGQSHRFHRHALGIALVVGGIPTLLQPISGDLLAKAVAEYQPVKLAAMEAQFRTTAGAPFRLGGIPDERTETVRYVFEIPYLLSFLLYFDSSATVQGLDRVPQSDWPPVAVVHLAFQIMVSAGIVMTVVVLWAVWRWKQGALYDDRGLLWALTLTAPLGFVAIEAGWTVTEVGRQPWIISGIMRTSEAVTPMPGIVVPFVLFTLLYGLLMLVVIWTIWRHIVVTGRLDIGSSTFATLESHGSLTK
jgi:cytochrome bd ubiquinol oxidase subunit I